MRFSIDTNILVYSVQPEDIRSRLASRIVADAVVVGAVLTNQVIGEFLNVASRRSLVPLDQARQTAADWSLLLPIAPTSIDHLIAASMLSERHRLQFWDALIITVSRAAGADCLLTEDMQDGAEVGGVRLVNPFNPINAELLDELLRSEP